MLGTMDAVNSSLACRVFLVSLRELVLLLLYYYCYCSWVIRCGSASASQEAICKDTVRISGWPGRVGVPLSSPFQTQFSYFSLKLLYLLNLEENVSNAARCSGNRPKTINEGRVGWLKI